MFFFFPFLFHSNIKAIDSIQIEDKFVIIEYTSRGTHLHEVRLESQTW